MNNKNVEGYKEGYMIKRYVRADNKLTQLDKINLAIIVLGCSLVGTLAFLQLDTILTLVFIGICVCVAIGMIIKERVEVVVYGVDEIVVYLMNKGYTKQEAIEAVEELNDRD